MTESVGDTLRRRGVTVLGEHRQAVIFAGTADELAPLTIGNERAWRRLIADYAVLYPGATRIVVRLDLALSGGTVRTMTEAQAKRAIRAWGMR